jgi:hypothetical protein
VEGVSKKSASCLEAGSNFEFKTDPRRPMQLVQVNVGSLQSPQTSCTGSLNLSWCELKKGVGGRGGSMM